MSRRHLIVLSCLCIGVGLVGIIGSMIPILSEAEENFGLDLLYHLRGPERARTNVIVVGIDSESSTALGLPSTPSRWPRAMHARLIERLSGEGAAVIVFDMIFHEPQDAINDQTLATAMHHAGNVVLTQTIDHQTVPITDGGPFPEARLTIERLITATPAISSAAVAQAPFPLPKVPIKLNQFWCFRKVSGNKPTLPVLVMHLWAKRAFLDFLHLLTDVDKNIDQILPGPIDDATDTQTIIGLISPLRSYFEENPNLADRMRSALEDIGPETPLCRSRTLIHRFITLYGYGSSRYLNLYGPPKTIPTISYHRLINRSDVGRRTKHDALSRLEGAVAFVGQSGSNWIKPYDGFYTAFSGKSGKDLGGVEIAATAFANLIEDRAVHPLGPVVLAILLMVWGAVGVLVSIRFGPVLAATILVACGGLYLGMASASFSHDGSWFPLVVPLLVQSPAAYIGGLIHRYRRATIEREQIRQAFGHYLPDPVVDRLSANIKELKLGGQVLYGICLFTDAQNYTTLSETMAPGELTRLMNDYYETIFRPIKANDGLVLQVVGDSVLAIWTASQPEESLNKAACRAAVDITAEVEAFNHDAGDHAMPTRIGIHAGDILLGNIGALDHFEYRPVGDIVNTASRLEGLNKFLGTRLLVSQEVMATDDDIRPRAVGRFVFKGKSTPVAVYELQSLDAKAPEAQAEIHRLFAAGMDAFAQRRWDEADLLFQRILNIDASDGPSLFYRSCCKNYKEAPPEEGWDGSIRLKEK